MRGEFDGLPDGRGLNMAHEAVDRHAHGPRRDYLALRWLGKDGTIRDCTYGDLQEQSNRFANVLASLECVAHARHDGGDHEIFIGRVVAISSRHPTRPRPLVFFRGRYGKLSTDASGSAPPPDALFLHGW